MREYIAFDSHKRYSLVEREDVATGKIVQQVRLTHAAGAGRTAHAAEESPDGHAGQVRGAAERVQRRVWKERAGRTGGADRTVARADALGLQAVAGADRFSGSADSAARAAAGGFGGGHAGDGAADDPARDCRDSGSYHRAGNRRP